VGEYGDIGIYISTARGLLCACTRRIVVIVEPPIGWDPTIDVAAANGVLTEYNQRARRAAADHDAVFVDIWDDITYVATCFGWSPATPTAPAAEAPSVWADGVHLSEQGDETVRHITDQAITAHRVLDGLLTLDRLDRATAAREYAQ